MSQKLDPNPGTDGVADECYATITIRVYTSGALQIQGPIEDLPWCLAVLENAKDAVRNHQRRRTRTPFIVPAHDVDVPKVILPGRIA